MGWRSHSFICSAHHLIPLSPYISPTSSRSLGPFLTPRSSARCSDRNAKVWHGAAENGPLNDGQSQTFAPHVYMRRCITPGWGRAEHPACGWGPSPTAGSALSLRPPPPPPPHGVPSAPALWFPPAPPPPPACRPRCPIACGSPAAPAPRPAETKPQHADQHSRPVGSAFAVSIKRFKRDDGFSGGRCAHAVTPAQSLQHD
jgi:hypothetical protein